MSQLIRRGAMIVVSGFQFHKTEQSIVCEYAPGFVHVHDREMSTFQETHDPADPAWEVFLDRYAQMQHRAYAKALRAARALIEAEYKAGRRAELYAKASVHAEVRARLCQLDLSSSLRALSGG